MQKLLFFLFCLLVLTNCHERKRVVIIDENQIYTTLNKGEFLDWDSNELREIANETYWQYKGYKHRNDLKGFVVEEHLHFNQPNTMVYIIKIDGFDDFYIPVGSVGTKEIK